MRRQPAHAPAKMAVGAGIVHRPVGGAFGPRAGHFESPVNAADGGIHQAAERPFSRLLEIAGDRIVVVPLYRGIGAERTLKGVNRGNYDERRDRDGAGTTKLDWKMHGVTLRILRQSESIEFG